MIFGLAENIAVSVFGQDCCLQGQVLISMHQHTSTDTHTPGGSAGAP